MLIPAPKEQTAITQGNLGYQQINATPDAFGGAIGQGLQSAGGNVGQAAEQQFNLAMKQQELKNETDAQAADLAYAVKLQDIQFNPQKGFQNLQGRDAVEGFDAARQAAADARDEVRQGLNPMAAKMFDQVATKRFIYATDSMQSHAQQQFKAYQNQTAESQIQNEVNTSALYWNDDNRFAQSLGTIKQYAIQRGENMGSSPDTIQSDITHYQSEAWKARITAVMSTDADKAAEMFAANADQIDAPHRAVLQQAIEPHQYTQMMRQNAEEARAEREATKALHTTQTTNEANLLADVVTGKHVDTGTLATMLRNQLISVEGFHSVLKQMKGDGDDEGGAAAVSLYSRLADGNLDKADVLSAPIKSSQKIGLLKLLAGQDKAADKSEAVGYYGSLKTLLDGHAVEQGIIADPGARAAATQKWGQAQEEWTQRVRVNGEPAAQVYQDMLHRYATPASRPDALPQPKFGQIHSSADVAAVVSATDQAFKAGRLTPQEYQKEGQLILNYKRIYARQEQIANARRAAKAGAQSIGQTPSE